MFGLIIMIFVVITILSMYAYLIIKDDDRTLPQRIKQRVKKHFRSFHKEV